MSAPGTDHLVLGTATPGGGFPLYGAALVAALEATDPGLRIEQRNTKGSTENVPLLREGRLDLALVQGEVAQEAVFAAPAADAPLIVAAMYPSPGMFVVRADSEARRIGDLVGRRIAFGARGSGLVILARHVLQGMGLDADRDFDAVYLDRAGDGPAMVASGEVAALWGAGIGWPGFTAVAAAPAGARFIVPDAAESARILARHPFLKPMRVPPGAYAGQGEEIAAIGSWSFVMARRDLPEAVGHRLAAALDRAAPRLAAALDQARETTARNTAAAAPRPEAIHPGVRRYLHGIGLLAEASGSG
jgi:TRAP transporter TAXI family solute receptor